MSVDAYAAKARIHSTAARDYFRDAVRIPRIGENAVAIGRRKLRIEQTVKRPLHISAKTQRMLFRNPLILIRQVFVHIDEYRIAAGNPSRIDVLRENRKVIYRTDG